MQHEKQKGVEKFAPLQESLEDRRLAAVFLGMSGALTARPEPRWIWDSTASGRKRYPGHDAVSAARSVVRRALELRDPSVLEESARRIVRYFDRLKDAALNDYRDVVSGGLSFPDAAIRAAKQSAEALREISRNLGTTRSPYDEITLDEVNDAIEALTLLRSKMRDRRVVAVAS
jgi:hypothetical protein